MFNNVFGHFRGEYEFSICYTKVMDVSRIYVIMK